MGRLTVDYAVSLVDTLKILPKVYQRMLDDNCLLGDVENDAMAVHNNTHTKYYEIPLRAMLKSEQHWRHDSSGKWY